MGEATKCFADLLDRFPRNADYQEEHEAACLAWTDSAAGGARMLSFLPAVGLTVAPNPPGAYQGYVGQQWSAVK